MSEEDVDPSTVAPAAADAEPFVPDAEDVSNGVEPSPSLAAQVPENEPAAADADAEPLPDAEAATDIVEPSPAAQMAVEENEGVSTTLPPATAAPPAAEVAAEETSDSTEPESAAPESAQDGLGSLAQAALDQPPGGTAVAGQAKTPDVTQLAKASAKPATSAGVGVAADVKDVSYSLPTKSLRAALAERGVPPPTDDDLVRLSGLFNEGLERARKLKNLEGFSFIMLFKEVDEDLSGYVTFDEFRRAVRDKIELKKAEFSDDELQALWCHLDRDDSNQILPEEMAPFLKLAPTATNAGLDAANRKAFLEAQAAARDAAAAPDKLDVSYAQPTSEIRSALAERSVAMPTDDHLMTLSKMFNEGLETARKQKNKEGFSWINLFGEVDEDSSGYVTFVREERAPDHTISLPLRSSFITTTFTPP